MLDEESHNLLLEKTSHLNNDGWKVFAHHMTITHRADRDIPLQEWAEKHLGEVFTLKAVRVGISEKALAIEVESDVPSSKAIKHVTIATSRDGKPVESNYIKKWFDVEPFNLKGVITRI
ncbi:MAG: hypothetical protein WC358_06880 [Ignavibacteria bacterium]